MPKTFRLPFKRNGFPSLERKWPPTTVENVEEKPKAVKWLYWLAYFQIASQLFVIVFTALIAILQLNFDFIARILESKGYSAESIGSNEVAVITGRMIFYLMFSCALLGFLNRRWLWWLRGSAIVNLLVVYRVGLWLSVMLTIAILILALNDSTVKYFKGKARIGSSN